VQNITILNIKVDVEIATAVLAREIRNRKEYVESHSVWTTVTRFNKNRYTKSKSRKGKAIPLQVWTGPEVSRRLRLPDFKTIGT